MSYADTNLLMHRLESIKNKFAVIVAIKANIVACLIPAAAFGKCFEAEYQAYIDYQYRAELLSPTTGVIVWEPRLGGSYRPIVIDQNPGFEDSYFIKKDYTGRVVAYVTSESIWRRQLLARQESKFAHTAAGDSHNMISWQQRMREREDYIFTVQQGQNVPIRRASESIVEIRKRAILWSQPGNIAPEKFPPDVSVDIKKWSVQLRNNYSDYMRAFELLKLSDAADFARESAIKRMQIAEGDAQQGMITCPIQCIVMFAHVKKGQRVNAGDRIASVASIHHKKAIISLSNNHVLFHLDPEKTVYNVSLRQDYPGVAAKSIGNLPSTVENKIMNLKGRVGNIPSYVKGSDHVTVELLLYDPEKNENTINVLSKTTKISFVPEEYAAASLEEQKAVDLKMSNIGLDCQ